MPYIKQKDRDKLKDRLDSYKKIDGFAAQLATLIGEELEAGGEDELKPGELNYMIYSLMVNAMNELGKNYQNCFIIWFATKNVENFYLKNLPTSIAFEATITSTLELARMEFYRRNIAPYEDLKIEENGDVL